MFKPRSTAQLAMAALVATAIFTTTTTAFPIYNLNANRLSSLLVRSDNTTSTLETCLSNTGGYDLSYSSSSDYGRLSSSYNPIFDYKPLVIAVPYTEDEVAGIVKCVSAQGGEQKLSPRSGGHSYQAYSLGGQDGSVVIDLRHLDNVTVDQDNKQATVGAGVRLGTLAQKIWDQGQFALPHGTCPMVGVAGHALGGGFGYTTRAWGFLLDRIAAMRIVTHNGQVLTVSSGENDDLWWGLRGGGANNFGVVTEFTFSLESAPSEIYNYVYSYKSNEDCAKAIVALQNMTLETSNQGGLESAFGGELLIAGEAGGDFNGNACQLSGQHIDTNRQAHDALMTRFHTQAGITPASSSVTPFSSWIDSLVNIMGDLNTTGKVSSDHEQFYAKSLVQPALPTYNLTSALALVNQLNSIAGLQGTGNSVSFDFLGPLSYPTSQVNASNSAFNAHTATFIYQFYSYAFPANDNPQAQQQVWNAFDQLVQTAKQSDPQADWGAYVNYVDARLQHWPHAYYGDALDRLKSLKTKWDPQSIFDFPQGLANA